MIKTTKNKLLLLLMAAIAVLCILTGCSQWELPYEEMNEKGYTVSVRFDPCGGAFAGTENVQIVDVFSLADAKKDPSGNYLLSLLSPDDSRRGDRAFAVSKNGCFFAGWYRECTPRTDSAGNPLDCYGNPTSESGLDQGYTYCGLWNFETDSLSVPTGGSYSSDTPYMTLYAAWIPYFNFEFYVKNDSGTFELYDSEQMISLSIPEWNTETGKLDMKGFPEIDGKTFVKAYLDAEMTKPVTETLSGEIDYEHGISATEKIAVYTEFAEGEWYRITNAKQFAATKLTGCYYIEADLDFTNVNWSAALAGGAFTGKIYGNGHKFSNISFIQADNSKTNGGLFGSIASGAVIKDIAFENVSYTLGAGSRMQAPVFGLLCGTLSEDALIEGVSITSSSFTISGDIYPQEYTLGTLVGNGDNRGIDISGIKVSVAEGAEAKISITVDDNTGDIALKFLN